MMQEIIGQVVGQIQRTEIVVNFDAADVFGIEPRFIGNRADNVAELDTVV